MKTLKHYLKACRQEGFCLGAYNFINMETLKSICEGCKKTHSPVIVSVSEGALEYMGENFVKSLFDSAKKTYNLPMFLHLDHGKSFEICKKAIELGFDSVMIDGSSLPFEQNVELTKKVCLFAHEKNVLVEAELGVLAGVEDNVSAGKNIFTNPLRAKEFVKMTGCDSLAVAIGTSHGAYKFKGEQTLRFDILSEIEKQIPNVPLVLHGASSVPQKYVEKINLNGGQLSGAVGIPEKLLSEAAAKHHIFKINCDTDIRLAYMAVLRENLNLDKKNIDIRKINNAAIDEIANMIAYKNENIFHNSNKG